MSDIPIFLILAGVALLFRWLKNRAENEQEGSAPSIPPNEPLPPVESERERVRRFLEALGAPPGAAPPPPVRPRTISPRRVVTPTPAATRRKLRRVLTQPLPPLTTRPSEEPLPTWPPVITAPSEPVVVETMPEPPPPAIATPGLQPPQTISTPTKIASTYSLGKSLGEILGKTGGLRQAVVLREILGPPRGLQNLGEI